MFLKSHFIMCNFIHVKNSHNKIKCTGTPQLAGFLWKNEMDYWIMEQTYFMNMEYISTFIAGTEKRFSVHHYTQDDSATSHLIRIYEHNLTVVNAINLWQEKFFFLVVTWQNDLQTGKRLAFLLSIEKHCCKTYNLKCTVIWN